MGLISAICSVVKRVCRGSLDDGRGDDLPMGLIDKVPSDFENIRDHGYCVPIGKNGQLQWDKIKVYRKATRKCAEIKDEKGMKKTNKKKSKNSKKKND